MRPLYGLGFAVGGLATGLALWLPAYARRWIGAGDVTLAGACGAWLGMRGIVRASLAGAIVGVTLALAMMVWQQTPKRWAADTILLVSSIRRSRAASVRWRAESPAAIAPPAARQVMPYGVAIVIGVLAVAWWHM
jgi:prepilin peptidase CpaA